ncbi:MAG: hypothetical protein A4E19_14220 [Nitrospira sp. SG-bin1]|nr:MAG: hypothetical protein A4E19_14220 [Nitrospira sp. SG-bin1]
MSQVTFSGHPLHPQLIVMPAGLLPFSLVLDLLHVSTKNRSFADASYYTMLGGLLGGLVAGTAGAMDYATIPRDHQAKRLGRLHGMMNVGLLTLTAFNVLMRRRNRTPRTLPMLLSLLGNVGLFVSAWYGGHLVYHHGMRVRGTELSGGSDENKLPGDESLARVLASTAQGNGEV